MSDCNAIRDRYFLFGKLPVGDPELDAHLAECESCRLAARGLEAVDHALAAPPPPFKVPSFDAIADAAASAARSRRRGRSVRRSLPFLATGFATAIAALVLAFVFTGRLPFRTPVLAVGARLDAAAAPQSGALESGARVKLARGEVKVVPAGKGEDRLFLTSGSVALEVPKLAAGHTVSVCTPDAEVRVHGTRFQVVRDARGTSVVVTEGLVEVRPYGTGRKPVFLAPGQSATVEPADAWLKGVRAAVQTDLDSGDFASAEQRLGHLLATDLAPEARAETHALLAWSLAATGNRRAAIERYRQALQTLPASLTPLWADNACAELSLLLEQEEPAGAAAAWGECLRRFPDGVHASLARARLSADRER